MLCSNGKIYRQKEIIYPSQALFQKLTKLCDHHDQSKFSKQFQQYDGTEITSLAQA